MDHSLSPSAIAMMVQQQQQQQHYSSTSTSSYGNTQSKADVFDDIPLQQLFEEHATISEDPHRKRRRRVHAAVRFAGEAYLYPSTVDIKSVPDGWYNRDELAVFKKERKNVVRVLKKVDFDTVAVCQSNYCLRGYEPYFSVAMNKATKYARELVNKVVLEEQKRQAAASISNPEALREVCAAATTWARANALELGCLDALESFALTLPMESWQALERYEANKEILQQAKQQPEQPVQEEELEILLQTPATPFMVSVIPEAVHVSGSAIHLQDAKMVKPGAVHMFGSSHRAQDGGKRSTVLPGAVHVTGPIETSAYLTSEKLGINPAANTERVLPMARFA